MKTLRKHLLLLCLLLGFLEGCVGTESPPPENTLPPTWVQTPSATTAATATTEPVLRGSLTIRIWLPPQFDPGSGTPAGGLLQARLDEFTLLHPGVRIEVRVKAALGPGGIIESLAATQAVAPDALPDLVALPRSALEEAAIRGLLSSYDSFDLDQTDSDWYEFARDLSRIKNITFGIPFAADALVLYYHPEVVDTPPKDWTTTLRMTTPLLFPAASPQALFTLILYQTAGGDIRQELGRPTINPATLASVFRFYEDAQINGVMPGWLTAYSSERSAIQAFKAGKANAAVGWVTTYWLDPTTDTAVSLLPTSRSAPYTLVNGWMWALSNPNSEHQDLSAELVRFLTDSDFLTRWTATAGYLPTRPSTLAGWPEASGRIFANQLVQSAQIIPSLDVLITLGPALKEATIAVLTKETDPAAAAQAAAESKE